MMTTMRPYYNFLDASLDFSIFPDFKLNTSANKYL